MNISKNEQISSACNLFCGLPEEVLFHCIVKDLDVRVWKAFSECSRACYQLANEHDSKAVKIRNEIQKLQIYTKRVPYSVYEEISTCLPLLNNPSNILFRNLADFIPNFSSLPIYDLNDLEIGDETLNQISSENVPYSIMRGVDKHNRPFLLIKESCTEVLGAIRKKGERLSILYQGQNDDSFFLSYRYDDGFLRFTKRRRRLSQTIRDISFVNIRTISELELVKSKCYVCKS